MSLKCRHYVFLIEATPTSWWLGGCTAGKGDFKRLQALKNKKPDKHLGSYCGCNLPIGYWQCRDKMDDR